ncbi:metallophosphoesterase [Chitinophaga sp. SYP-B3965]|nr:metallophosphoesterase [Chitinophaga sp. SYP-B3965]
MQHKVFLLLISVFFSPPKGIHLSWNGGNTSTTIGITWLNDPEAVVLFGTDSNHLNKKARPQSPGKTTLHKLKPATRYYYKVGASAIYSFKTAPPLGDKKEIVIGVWSDTQNNGGNYNFEQTDTIIGQMRKHAFDFTLHTGDIVENGSVEKSWNNFFDIAEPLNANYPFMSVTGNHDVINKDTDSNFQKPFPIFYNLFNLPRDQLNYSYDYGNTHFVAVNSGYAQGAEKKGAVLLDVNSADYQWLEADLAKAKKNKKICWTIVYCHYPLYAFGVSRIPTWHEHLQGLLDKYGVDLCLSGHRHVYERHTAVFDSHIWEPRDQHVYDNPVGTVYITNGSAGGSLQGVGGSDLPTMMFTPKEKQHTYAIMRIRDNHLYYEVFNKAGEKMDHVEIVKVW